MQRRGFFSTLTAGLLAPLLPTPKPKVEITAPKPQWVQNKTQTVLKDENGQPYAILHSVSYSFTTPTQGETL